jgi:8-oxo-dGTP pyrophosphatase MutT (NUDIX family)
MKTDSDAGVKKTRHHLTENVKLLQKAALVSAGQVLLLKRAENSRSRPRCWDLPGGNTEWPKVAESQGGLLRNDIVREIKEETGVAVAEDVFTTGSLIFFDTFFESDRQVYSIITGWVAELPLGFDRSKIKLSSEHTDYEWVGLEELNEFNFGGEQGDFIRKMAETALLCVQEDEEDHSCACGGCGHC